MLHTRPGVRCLAKSLQRPPTPSNQRPGLARCNISKISKRTAYLRPAGRDCEQEILYSYQEILAYPARMNQLQEFLLLVLVLPCSAEVRVYCMYHQEALALEGRPEELYLRNT